jgi:sarcosine oxidase subunit beta
MPGGHNMQTADVVIVGGGIVGSSIARQLAASGYRSLLVIEREPVQGKGSSGRSMGGVRAQFSPPLGTQISLYSIPFYRKFEANLGCPCDYQPQGCLFCTAADKQRAYLRTNYTLQAKTGL